MLGFAVVLAVTGCDETSTEDSGRPQCAALSETQCADPDNDHCDWFTVWTAAPDTCEVQVLESRCADAEYVGAGCGHTDAPGCGEGPAWVVATDDGTELWRGTRSCGYRPAASNQECGQASDGSHTYEGCACGCP